MNRAFEESYHKALNAVRKGKQPKRMRGVPLRHVHGMKGREVDETTVRELELYAENTGSIYPQLQSIHKNLINKRAAGKYDSERAVKAFSHFVETAARSYAREHAANERDWNVIFPKPVRDEVARRFRHEFEVEARMGNYNDYLYKKYRR